MKRAIGLVAVGMLTAGTVGTAWAHHSFAIFDHSRTYMLTGKVKSFQWTNPHGYIDLDVKEPRTPRRASTTTRSSSRASTCSSVPAGNLPMSVPETK